MNQIKNGYLVISLDFELLWGVFDVMDAKKNLQYFLNTREIIPSILHEFTKYGVHATWATVGMLFNSSWEEWKKNTPSRAPKYEFEKLSSYSFGLNNYKRLNETLCFAPDIIKQIADTAGQEIGTHTYSHYYCMEPGQELSDFRADLEMAIKLAGKINIELKSLVFPRNQLNRDYLKICYELGIENVRSNPDSWYWKNTRSDSIITKVARTGDAYIPLGKKSYSIETLNKKPGFPVEQMAGRFLRPVETNKNINKLKISRIKSEMLEAAKRGEIYHVWWHPHNFGTDPQGSVRDLKLILEHYQILNKKFNFQSVNMAGIGNLYVN